MENKIGQIWVSLAAVTLVVIIGWNGDSLKPIETRSGDAPFLIALTQLGILYIVALFVERAVEVLIKVWRQGGKVHLQEEITKNEGNDEDKTVSKRKLGEYKAGTQRRALLAGLTLGILVSVSGVRLLGPIFQLDSSDALTFQLGVFQFTDIVITAGLIAGGSATIHELMALIDDFLRVSRKKANSG